MLRSTGELSTGEIPEGLSLAVTSAFKELLKEPDIELVYLIELSPYDDTKETFIPSPAPTGLTCTGEFGFSYQGGEERVYISDVGFFTEPGDSLPNTSYLPLTSNPFQFDVSILSGEEFRGGLPSFGAIRLINADGELDRLTSYYWGGRNISVYAGGRDFSYSQFEKIFEGLATEPEFNEEEIIINISDKSSLLETEFKQTLYLGTGGLEGGDDLRNAIKPLAFGECYNVSAVLVDSENLIYQVHDGSMEEVMAVYDKGVELTSGGDVEDITSSTVSAGQYKTQLSGGYIKLGTNPSGRITADVKGDNEGGYSARIGAIIRNVVTKRLGFRSLSTSEIDGGAFNRFDEAVPVNSGLFINSETDARRILDDLVNPVHGFWVFTRSGLLSLGVIDAPSLPVLEINEDMISDGSFEVDKNISPAWQIEIGFKKNWTSQNDDELAAASELREFTREDFRKLVIEDRSIRRKTNASVKRAFSTYLSSLSEAEGISERMQRIYGAQRQIIKVTVSNLLFRVFIGDTITLRTSRAGLENGKPFFITSISEDAETNETRLELWG